MRQFKAPGGAPPAAPTEDQPPPPAVLEREGGVVVFDIEIANCIPMKNEPQNANYRYCEGWGDHKGMGIAVCAAYDILKARPLIFFEDNLDELAALVERADMIVGFNNHAFDNKILAAHGIEVAPERTCDIMQAIRMSLGMNPRAVGPSGINLEALHAANFPASPGKYCDSALAPQYWQDGKRGLVTNLCLGDMHMTTELLQLALATGLLNDPRDRGNPPFSVREHLPIELVNYAPWHQLIPGGTAAN